MNSKTAGSISFATIGQPATLLFDRFQCGPEVKPRRKDGSRPESVMITLDVITKLMEYPLSEAASRMGISATAFKKACRKLGLQRWTYTKHGSRNSLGKNASHMVTPNSAYAKHILRKYTPCSKSPKRSSSDTKIYNTGGKPTAVQTTAFGTEVSTPEQIEEVLETGVLNDITSTWSGPPETFVNPLKFSDIEQIFAEELMLDDDCALAMLAAVWNQSSFVTNHDH